MGQDAFADRAYDASGQQTAYDVVYGSGVAVEYSSYGPATVLGTNIQS
jgi:hypothetical protein